jgi:hypothetical protein
LIGWPLLAYKSRMVGQIPIKIPFELTDARRSGFRLILSLLDLPAYPTTVDVGAGGFQGEATTEPVLEILQGKIVCIEADAAKSAALGTKMGDRIVNICGPYGEIGAKEPHDLLIHRHRHRLIAQIFERLLEFVVRDGLMPGGYLICFGREGACLGRERPRHRRADRPRKPVTALLKKHPSWRWDEAVAEIARRK